MNLETALAKRIADHYGLNTNTEWTKKISEILPVVCRRHGIDISSGASKMLHNLSFIREIAGNLTIEETFFLRQPGHFDYLLDFLANRFNNTGPNEPVRVWSAGCSRGDEPYTLAILANERFTRDQLNRLDIVANDLNLKAISNARQGIFTDWSFREADDNFKTRYFKRGNNRHYQLNENIKEMVRFEHLSIQEYIERLPHSGLDAILFRNVGVYFDKTAIQNLYRSFAKVLKRDGCLLVSPTDPQPSRELFQASSANDVTIYKPTDAKPRSICSLLARPVISETIEKPKARVRRLSSIPAQHERILPHIDSVRNLADRGDYESALDECAKFIRLDPKNSEAHRLRGELLLHHAEAEQAVLDFKRAVSLTPDDPITRYWYALGLEAAGDIPGALQEARELIGRLGSQPENTILSDGETRVAELVYAVTSIERNLS